ncbi:MAG: hypothetical protein HQM02_10910, partial [Magnetococcales bacterium]|nr:hypothetical protein [Magnetococcales bacterium]
MAFFLLIRQQGATAPPADLPTRFTAAGLPLRHHLQAGGWQLWMFGKFNEPALPLVRTPEGDLATATGWFSFDGRGGEEGLRRCLAIFDGTSLPLSRCRGHFNLVLRKQGRWYLLQDAMDAAKVYHDSAGNWFSNSFYALLCGIRAPEPDPQGCYEYAFNGTLFGEKSFVKQIRTVPAGTMTVLDREVTHLPLP